MSVECKFASAVEARKANYFSRRHRTAEEHQEARKNREACKTTQYQATQERVERQNARTLDRVNKGKIELQGS